jgi:drug/metabolite transporter (DMT)-like permease
MSTYRLMAIAQTLNPKLLGAGFMLLWAMSFCMAMAFAKTLSPEVDSVVVLFMRCFFGLLFFSPFVLRTGFKGFVTSRPLLQLIRVLFVGAAMGCTYYAYRHLPLAFATSIGMTGPLFTTILSMTLLRDSVSLSKWGLILFGYFGVIVMVQPHEMPISLGVWVELLGNLFVAMAIISTKLLSRTESTLTIMFYGTTTTTFIVGILAISVWKTPALSDLVTLVAVGGFGVLSQYSYVTALKYANPSYLAPFEYTRLCFAIPLGFLFFEEIPTWWTLLGSLMIVAATYGLTRLELMNDHFSKSRIG